MTTRKLQGGDTRLSIQPLDITKALYGRVGLEATLTTLVFKYVMRRNGSRVDDLVRAKDCIDRLIKLAEARDEN